MNVTELKKALDTSNGSALLPYDLDTTLAEELIKLQPLTQLLSTVQAEGKTHEYNIRSTHPMAWFEGENTTANDQTGGYQRKSVQLKIQRIWGSVSGFAQTIDEKFINALTEEINGSLQGMADLIEYSIMYGTAGDIGFTGDAYQYTGILPRVFSLAPENVIDGGSAKVTLDMLDQALAKAARFRQTRTDPSLWLMGIRMKQVVDGLQTKVQMPLTSAELADGKLVMATYAKRPIYETDYLVPDTVSTSPTASSAVAGASGTLAAATYTYMISSVTAFGEQVGGTAATGLVIDGSTNKKATVTWTADSTAKLYMIWRKAGAGAYGLLDIIPALTYDAAGKVNGTVATYSDDGSKTPKAVKPLLAGEEQIAIINTNPARGAAFVGKIDDMGRQIDKMVSMVELARVKDSYDYMLKNYQALRVKYPNLMSVIRHCKTS